MTTLIAFHPNLRMTPMMSYEGHTNAVAQLSVDEVVWKPPEVRPVKAGFACMKPIRVRSRYCKHAA